MPNLNERQNLSDGLKNDDLFKTSYGVGHHWRPGFYFPDSITMLKLNNVEPCGIENESQVKAADHFQTTNSSVHDQKILPEILKSSHNPPPPHHWDLHYINDFRSRYLAGGYRRPLSPSQQTTEMKDSFRGAEGPSELWRPLSMKPFELENHHTDGPSKKIIASTENPDLSRRILYPKDKEIFRNLDPYLTTNMKDHRMWTREELNDVAKNRIATYWNLKEYPESKGFGLSPNPLPKDGIKNEKLPMRDTLQFKYATDHVRVRPISYHVPHTGLETTYQSEYAKPNSILRKADLVCPVETPYTLPGTVLSLIVDYK
uniref:Uncharacterized protein n=1 Tax=Trichobilharzia regenti TaxID=157069 RepID=A0AA85IQN8_TRIRE|nr:unnamed protein product [Trichobilharzia regenti]